MFHEQMINFLEATIVFLLMTNALSVFAATYAIRIASSSVRNRPEDAEVTRGREVLRRFGWQ
jgi:hypothetical protein